MKKTFLFICCLFSLATLAEDKIASYSMSYFNDRVFNIEASEPKTNGDFTFYIYVAGERENDKVCLGLDRDKVPAFKSALEVVKGKYVEWKNTAIANKVTDINKEFPISFPKMSVAWLGSKWWFAFNRIFTPQFFVFKDGSCAVVTTAKVKSSSNEYIEQRFYLVFEDVSEIDTLLNALDCDAVVQHYNGKQKSTDLFN